MSNFFELIDAFLPVFVLIVLILAEIKNSSRIAKIEVVLSDIDQFLGNMVVIQVVQPGDLDEEVKSDPLRSN